VPASSANLIYASGIERTIPRVRVFEDPAEGAAWNLRHESDPLINETAGALARAHARWDVFGDLAAARTSAAAQYVSTAMVSRDMLAITRAHGYDKIKYMGYSYGTVLGITFAAMFPDNIERLLVE
jgi:pimeloyl-ACP methyl ester carboxylesterase